MLHLFASVSVTKIIGLLVAGFLFVLGWLKRKAIEAAWKALTNARTRRFWSWVHRQMSAHAPENVIPNPVEANHKTYYGTFQGYYRYANPPKEHYFRLTHKGRDITVPVIHTNLFSEVRAGDFVEIDTQVGLYYGREVVQRVRKINRHD